MAAPGRRRLHPRGWDAGRREPAGRRLGAGSPARTADGLEGCSSSTTPAARRPLEGPDAPVRAGKAAREGPVRPGSWARLRRVEGGVKETSSSARTFQLVWRGAPVRLRRAWARSGRLGGSASRILARSVYASAPIAPPLATRETDRIRPARRARPAHVCSTRTSDHERVFVVKIRVERLFHERVFAFGRPAA